MPTMPSKSQVNDVFLNCASSAFAMMGLRRMDLHPSTHSHTRAARAGARVRPRPRAPAPAHKRARILPGTFHARSLYFIMESLVQTFYMLKYGIAAVLILIGQHGSMSRELDNLMLSS